MPSSPRVVSIMPLPDILSNTLIIIFSAISFEKYCLRNSLPVLVQLFCTHDITTKYISRYFYRSVIVTSRIDDYDGDNVTFHHTRHEDNKTVTETIPALGFIKKLTVHIQKNISKCSTIMGYMQRGSVNVFMLKNNVFCILFKASDNPFCSPSDTILSVVSSGILLYCF